MGALADADRADQLFHPIADSFTITAALLFGPWAGVIAVALEGLVVSFRLRRTDSFAQRGLASLASRAEARRDTTRASGAFKLSSLRLVGNQ